MEDYIIEKDGSTRPLSTDEKQKIQEQAPSKKLKLIKQEDGKNYYKVLEQLLG